MEITAGLRCPSFCQSFGMQWDVSTYNITNRVAGSQLVVIPRECVFVDNSTSALNPRIGMFSGYTDNGATITFNTSWSTGQKRDRTFPLSLWQILPAGSGQGLLISDSTDFMSISDASMSGFCVWRGTITVNGRWAVPDTIAPKDKYMVFAKWSQDGVVVDFDGNTISVFVENDGDEQLTNVAMTVAIFASGVSPQPGPGLNMFRNGSCVFSTKYRPFIYRNTTWSPSFDWRDIGGNMIMLGRYGYRSRPSGGWNRLKYAGLVMSGNSVRCAGTAIASRWTSQYNDPMQDLTTLAVPTIPPMY